MSSLALVPYTFSLSKLPLVALQNVADCLNPYEIYHFSRISKRTNNLAKALSKKAICIFFSQCSIEIKLIENKTWYIMPRSLPEPDLYIYQCIPIYAFFSKQPGSEGLKVLERVIDLFKCSKVYLDFNALSSRRQDLFSFFNWLIESPSEVPRVSMTCSHAQDVQFFLENYKKPSKYLNLELRYEDDEQLDLPANFETNLFEQVHIHNSHAVNFALYNIFSCSTLNCYEKQLTNQDLNTFLKNWQSGLTNSHWKSVCIKMSTVRVNLKDVLKDITATYRDPRTVKRQVSTTKESFWIFGGIDIQNHDGTATATIQWKDYKVENEDSEVPNKYIREYERYKESGEIQRRDEGHSFLRFLELHVFSMYIW